MPRAPPRQRCAGSRAYGTAGARRAWPRGAPAVRARDRSARHVTSRHVTAPHRTAPHPSPHRPCLCLCARSLPRAAAARPPARLPQPFRRRRAYSDTRRDISSPQPMAARAAPRAHLAPPPPPTLPRAPAGPPSPTRVPAPRAPPRPRVLHPRRGPGACSPPRALPLLHACSTPPHVPTPPAHACSPPQGVPVLSSRVPTPSTYGCHTCPPCLGGVPAPPAPRAPPHPTCAPPPTPPVHPVSSLPPGVSPGHEAPGARRDFVPAWAPGFGFPILRGDTLRQDVTQDSVPAGPRPSIPVGTQGGGVHPSAGATAQPQEPRSWPRAQTPLSCPGSAGQAGRLRDCCALPCCSQACG